MCQECYIHPLHKQPLEMGTGAESGLGSHAYHGEGFSCLVEQGLRQQGDVNALWDGHCPTIQICYDDVQLKAARQV